MTEYKASFDSRQSSSKASGIRLGLGSSDPAECVTGYRQAKMIRRPQMESFGIIGMGIGILGMGLGATAFTRLEKLVKELKEADVLKKDWK